MVNSKVRDGLAKVPEFTSTADNRYFPETGHSVRGEFLKAWDQRGGVNIFGYTITAERREVNPVDGKVYIEQYCERARFEWHDEIAELAFRIERTARRGSIGSGRSSDVPGLRLWTPLEPQASSPCNGCAATLSGNTVASSLCSSARRWSRSNPLRTARRSAVGFKSRFS